MHFSLSVYLYKQTFILPDSVSYILGYSLNIMSEVITSHCLLEHNNRTDTRRCVYLCSIQQAYRYRQITCDLKGRCVTSKRHVQRQTSYSMVLGKWYGQVENSSKQPGCVWFISSWACVSHLALALADSWVWKKIWIYKSELWVKVVLNTFSVSASCKYRVSEQYRDHRLAP